MPKITKIEQQQKRKDRYSIFVDGKFSFALPEYEIATANINRGDELSEEQLERFKELASESKVYDKAIHYLSFRPRSIKEVRDHFRQKQVDPAEVETAIERLEQQGLLDDAAFARSWVESRGLLKPSSKRKLVMELRQKGVAADIVEEILSEMSPEDEIETIKQIVQKKTRQSASWRNQDQRTLTDYLLRQGFSYHQIQAALEDLQL